MAEATDTSAASLPHSGMVALVGRANVGKSTLMNRLMEEKVSIVSPVPQTTRNMIRGILTDSRGQLVLLDTPGVHKARHELGKVMNRTARRSIEGVDAVLLVLDGSSPVWEEDEGWMRKLAKESTPVVMALNKSDLGLKHEPEYRACWARVAAERPGIPEPRWVSLSATTGAGTAALTDLLFGLLPPGPALFPVEILTDFPRKLNIADVIREKLFGVLKQELPHAIAVRVEDIVEEESRWTVRAVIYVDKPTQKPIVIGHKGRLLRKVKRQSEAELRAMYEKEVAVEMWVKVEPNWAGNYWIRKQLGYEG
jgi:GTP-binding protein Era